MAHAGGSRQITISTGCILPSATMTSHGSMKEASAAIHRRRHHNELQVAAPSSADPAASPVRDPFEMPLMKFVEDHRTDVPAMASSRIRRRSRTPSVTNWMRPREGTSQNGSGSPLPAGAHTLGGDAQGEQSRCQTPRLRHDDPAPHHATIDEYLRQLR